MEHCRSAFASATVHPASTVPAAPVLPHFTHCCFCYNFWFLPILTLVIALVLVFFFVISYTLSTYISLSLYKLKSTQLTSRRQYSEREPVSPLLPHFSIFFHFLSSFSAAKYYSEDDNSEDGWLDLFLLEEEGCWLGCGGNSRFPYF